MRIGVSVVFCVGCLIAGGIASTFGQTGKAKTEPLEQLAARAEAAIDRNDLPQAIQIYEQATALHPDWVEGWWHLGTLFFDAGRFLEARRALVHFVTTERTQPGPGFAMLGLTEFHLKEYSKALADLERSDKLGLGTNPDFTRTALYYDGILNSFLGRPEIALQRLTLLANQIAAAHPDAPKDAVLADGELLDAFGIAALRIAKLPSSLSREKAPLIREVGNAQALIALQDRVAAGEQFKRVLALYPSASGVHYAYGVFLLKENPTLAIDEFRREIQLSPSSYVARIQLALEFQKIADTEQALKFAKQAVLLAPKDFVAHIAYGRASLALGKTQTALQELQIAVRLAPSSPDAHFALSRALAQAGKNAEAERERAEFERLNASNLNVSPNAAPQ